MKKLVVTAFLATMSLAALPTVSSAMPTSPRATTVSGLVQDIAYGCPRGTMPNKWGRCVAAYRPAPRYYNNGYYNGYNNGSIPANRSGYGRACPPGTWLGPQGGYCHPRY